MFQAWVSGDPEYSPKAAVWLTERAARAGAWNQVQGIGTTINCAYGPFFLHNDFEQHERLASQWRYQLLDNLHPVNVLRATHALAQFDGVTETPSLQILLRDYLQIQLDPEIPASQAHLWQPWWLATLDAHRERGTLPELIHDLFCLVDRFYSHVAWAYAEYDVEDPLGLVRDLVHTVDDFPWGTLLQESNRQRMNAIFGSELLRPGWPHLDRPDEGEAES